MKKVDTNVNELVGMIRRGELRLPEMQRRYVWRAPRVRDLLDSLYRGYPSGSILVWETDQQQPTRDLAVSQDISPFSGHKLLLDGQQRLTSLSSVVRGEPVKVRGRRRPIDILFNLEHPEGIGEYAEVAEIFVRVNSLGMKLRGSDLALAQITARWPNSLKLLEQFQEECEEKWFTLDLGLLVRTMVVFATGQSRFKTLGNVPIEKLKDGWEK